MQAPAIEDHITTKLYEWYTVVAEWEPPGEGSSGICVECAESALASTIDVSAWPHEVIHLLVASLRTAIADVQASYTEESAWDRDCASAVARNAVAYALARHASDIQDVLEQCLPEKLQSYFTLEVELGECDLRRRAAS